MYTEMEILSILFFPASYLNTGQGRDPDKNSLLGEEVGEELAK